MNALAHDDLEGPFQPLTKGPHITADERDEIVAALAMTDPPLTFTRIAAMFGRSERRIAQIARANGFVGKDRVTRARLIIHTTGAKPREHSVVLSAIARIMACAEELTGIGASQISGPARTADISRIRQAVCMAAVAHGYSLPRIGRALKRHHATILYSNRVAQWHYQHDPDFRALVDQLVRAAA